MMRKGRAKLIFTFFFVLAVVFLAEPATAQVTQTGAIRGYVTDEDG